MSRGKPTIAFSDHARRRFAERYRLSITADDLRRMVACIQRGEAVLLKPDVGDERAVYATPRPSRKGKKTKMAPVVYDRRFQAIVTVLPENCLWPFRKLIREFRDKRIAEQGANAWPLKLTFDPGPVTSDEVRLALDSEKLCYHVQCQPAVCVFPVSIYVRDVGPAGWGRREIVYLKANGFSAGSYGAAMSLLRQQFKTCLAVRTGVAPANTAALTEAFINKLAQTIRSENLTWAGFEARARAAAA